MALIEALQTSPGWLFLATALLGLCAGSFLNVVIHRLPIMMERKWRAECDDLHGQEAPVFERLDLMSPPSRCPKCGAGITALQNVPMLSWLVLRGKCAKCRTPIAFRYPLVELLGGALAVLMAWRF